MPGYECFKTAGSFFKNPVVGADKFRDLRLKIADSDQWFWQMPGDRVKVAAAKLMQTAGFPKGHRQGPVGISPKHALSLVNFDGAKAGDIKALSEQIRQAIRDKFDVSLEEEVLFVGKFDPDPTSPVDR